VSREEIVGDRDLRGGSWIPTLGLSHLASDDLTISEQTSMTIIYEDQVFR
jgi:hypothetical protein